MKPFLISSLLEHVMGAIGKYWSRSMRTVTRRQANPPPGDPAQRIRTKRNGDLAGLSEGIAHVGKGIWEVCILNQRAQAIINDYEIVIGKPLLIHNIAHQRLAECILQVGHGLPWSPKSVLSTKSGSWCTALCYSKPSPKIFFTLSFNGWNLRSHKSQLQIGWKFTKIPTIPEPRPDCLLAH